MQLTKHHGLGNDFLVALADSEPADLADLARAVCHRRTGVGADGLIVGVPDAAADIRMILHNADGSRAEMSGNGIRCLAQAEFDRRGGTDALRIVTDGGLRTVGTELRGDEFWASVDMGPVTDGPDVAAPVAAASTTQRVETADVGNPHIVVLVDDPAEVDVATVGPGFEAFYPDGINVEFIAPRGTDRLDLRVWERGSGITLACGTGATAAAHVAHRWGLVGDEVTVAMPGGCAEVLLGDTATLVGPAVHIADIDWRGGDRG